MRKKPEIELNKHEKKCIAEEIMIYLEENFELQIGNLQAEMFEDFITEKIGKFYYNHALDDSMDYFRERTEDLVLLIKE